MRTRPVALLFALACILPAAHADEPVPSVQVKGIADPEMRSYRSVVAGFACPRCALTYVIGAPAASSRLAKVCRRS